MLLLERGIDWAMGKGATSCINGREQSQK